MFGGGGFGGGDAGNQFAGGGFMPSQANDGGYGGGGGGSGGNKKNSAQSLRTLTIRQLAKDVGNSDDDTHMVDGVELAQLTVVGKVLSVQDRNNSLVMVLSDGTGELEVTHWLQEESEHAMQAKKAELRVGSYVKAHGHMQRMDKKLALSAFNMRAITNFNEVTYHFLRAIFEHLHLTKGQAGAAGAAGVGGPQGGFGNPIGGAGGGGWGGAPAQQQQQPMGGGGGGATAFAGGVGNDSCQVAVYNLISSANSDQGMHVEQMYNTLSGQFNRAQIDVAIQGLSNDAHLYNTVDDNHWKTA